MITQVMERKGHRVHGSCTGHRNLRCRGVLRLGLLKMRRLATQREHCDRWGGSLKGLSAGFCTAFFLPAWGRALGNGRFQGQRESCCSGFYGGVDQVVLVSRTTPGEKIFFQFFSFFKGNKKQRP